MEHYRLMFEEDRARLGPCEYAIGRTDHVTTIMVGCIVVWRGGEREGGEHEMTNIFHSIAKCTGNIGRKCWRAEVGGGSEEADESRKQIHGVDWVIYI